MMNKLVIAFLVPCFLLSSCIKKEQKISDSGKVIQLLNKNEGDEALREVEQLLEKDPTNEELLYLKASALSILAGVDIYNLFPLLKAKMFDVAISQWSENREFEKRMKNRRDFGSNDDAREDKEKTGLKYIEPKKEKIKFTIQNFNQWVQQSGGKSIGHVYLDFISPTTGDDEVIHIYKQFMLGDAESEIFFKESSRRDEYDPVDVDTLNDQNINLRNFVIPEILKRHKLVWDEREEKKHKQKSDLKMIQGLWAVLDMLPLIKKIPRIDLDKFKRLEIAQEILLDLVKKNAKNKNASYEKSRKQLLMISSLKIIARIQVGIELDKIDTPTDFYCYTNDDFPEQIVEGRKDVALILYGIDDENIREKNAEVFSDIDNILKDMDKRIGNEPEVREQLIKSLTDDLRKTREECNMATEEESSI